MFLMITGKFRGDHCKNGGWLLNTFKIGGCPNLNSTRRDRAHVKGNLRQIAKADLNVSFISRKDVSDGRA